MNMYIDKSVLSKNNFTFMGAIIWGKKYSVYWRYVYAFCPLLWNYRNDLYIFVFRL